MIEEPYRWVEAIANRREYIETQLAAGSPIAAVGYRDGILLLTLGSTRHLDPALETPMAARLVAGTQGLARRGAFTVLEGGRS